MKRQFKVFLTVLITIYSNQVKCQDAEIKQVKNAILINGANAYFIGMYSFEYERNIFERKIFETLIRIGYGGWYYMDTGVFTNIIEGKSIITSVNGLIGENSHKFEFNIGVRYVFLEDWEIQKINQYHPIINIGYRYQNPIGKGLIFRAYLGETGIGIAVGKAF